MITRPPHRLTVLLLLLPLTLLLLGADAPTAPGKNLSLPTFTKEGWRETWLRAATVLYDGPTRLDATGVNFTQFKGNAANDVDTVLTSPAATATIDRAQNQLILRGDSTVHLVRGDGDLEVSGEQWSYDHVAKTILIEKNTRVVFRAQLPDLLK
jgi:hypothetical protein